MPVIQKKPKRTDLIYLLLLMITVIWVYHATYDKKLFLGGDNVVYYITGKAIADGKGYTDISSPYNLPETWFPPGYPFISAGIMKIFGEKIEVMNQANGFFLFGSLVFLYLVIARLLKNKHLAFIITFISGLNMHVLSSSIIAMSEIPFLFTSLGAIYFFMRMERDKLPFKDANFWLFFLFLIFSHYIRPTGIILVGAVIFYLLTQKKWKLSAIIMAGFIICAAPWYIRNSHAGGNRNTASLMRKNYYRPELGTMNTAGDWLSRIGDNAERYISLEIPSAVISYKIEDMKVYDKTLPEDREWLAGILFVALCIAGFFFLKDYRWLFLSYLGGTFALLMVCPEEWVGVRLITAVIPLMYLVMILAVYTGLCAVTKKMGIAEKTSVSFLPFLFLFFILIEKEGITYLVKYSKIEQPYCYARYFDAAKWAKTNLPSNSIVVCRKPEFFYLYSGCKSVNYLYTKNADSLILNMKEKNATHVVLEQLGFASTNNYLYPAIKKNPEKFKTLLHLKFPDTFIFEIHYDCGYEGEMKEGKRNGKGTLKKADGSVYDGYWENDVKKGQGSFTWANGLKFEGEFSNNLRNGPGTLFLQNGKYLKATWVNDTANGPGILYNSNGTVSKQGMLKNNVFVK
jgi:hypothetical protein